MGGAGTEDESRRAPVASESHDRINDDARPQPPSTTESQSITARATEGAIWTSNGLAINGLNGLSTKQDTSLQLPSPLPTPPAVTPTAVGSRSPVATEQHPFTSSAAQDDDDEKRRYGNGIRNGHHVHGTTGITSHEGSSHSERQGPAADWTATSSSTATTDSEIYMHNGTKAKEDGKTERNLKLETETSHSRSRPRNESFTRQQGGGHDRIRRLSASKIQELASSPESLPVATIPNRTLDFPLSAGLADSVSRSAAAAAASAFESGLSDRPGHGRSKSSLTSDIQALISGPASATSRPSVSPRTVSTPPINRRNSSASQPASQPSATHTTTNTHRRNSFQPSPKPPNGNFTIPAPLNLEAASTLLPAMSATAAATTPAVAELSSEHAASASDLQQQYEDDTIAAANAAMPAAAPAAPSPAIPAAVAPTFPLPPMSVPTFLQLELAGQRPSPLYIHHSYSNDIPYESSAVKLERLKNFLLLPSFLERTILFGALACLDAFLWTFTILPMRFVIAIGVLVKWWAYVVGKESRWAIGYVWFGMGRWWRRGRARGRAASRIDRSSAGEESRSRSRVRDPSVGSVSSTTVALDGQQPSRTAPPVGENAHPTTVSSSSSTTNINSAAATTTATTMALRNPSRAQSRSNSYSQLNSNSHASNLQARRGHSRTRNASRNRSQNREQSQGHEHTQSQSQSQSQSQAQPPQPQEPHHRGRRHVHHGGRGGFRHRRTKSLPSGLTSFHKADILQGLVILVSSIVLMRLDASRMYHFIRAQSAIKLYVIYNGLEVGDRLLSALGQDIFECLFSSEVLSRDPQSGRSKVLLPFGMFLLALAYNITHAVALFYQVITLNVAVNSYSNALLTLLISNQFVEIKSSVFKRFEKENTFQLTCADVVERFQLWIMLLIIAMRNIVEVGGLTIPGAGTGGGTGGGGLGGMGGPSAGGEFGSGGDSGSSNLKVPLHSASILPASFTALPAWLWSGEVLSPFLIVTGSETIVDWIKHAYINKFNNIKPNFYSRVLDILCKDYYTNAFVTPSLTRRLGLPLLPLSCLFIRASVQTYHMFLATLLPAPLPPSTQTALAESSTATPSSPAMAAALERFDTLIRNALGRAVHGLPQHTSTFSAAPDSLPRGLSLFGRRFTSDDAIAALTMLVVFFLFFLVLLVVKLILGMLLLRYSRSRYAAMRRREMAVAAGTMEPEVFDQKGSRRVGGYGQVEVGDERRGWLYADDKEGLNRVQNQERRNANKRERSDRDLGKISRYEMVAKRIW